MLASLEQMAMMNDYAATSWDVIVIVRFPYAYKLCMVAHYKWHKNSVSGVDIEQVKHCLRQYQWLTSILHPISTTAIEWWYSCGYTAVIFK